MNEISQKLLLEANRVILDEIKSLEKAATRLNEKFAQAVILMSNANKVILSGIGKSGLVAKKIAASLSSIGVSSVFLHPVESLHGDLGMVQKGDVVILLSKSGSTEEIVRLVPYLKMRNAGIISIIGNMNSFLATNSDIALDGSVDYEACPHNLVPTSSTLVAQAIGDALVVGCMHYKKVTIEDFARLHPLGQLGKNITLKVKDIAHTKKHLPAVTSSDTFKTALIEITEKGLGCAVVIDSKGILEGIITDGDIRRALQKFNNIEKLKVSEIMTANPVTISSEAFLGEALGIMENRPSQINVLPVVDAKNKCIGVVRLHDILRSGQ
ncbi:MAG: KpsF/GutQ family sugar-phosphate isomerase [Ignavibacteria bacterium]|nr:KpsF/GutQ family sugar-phosphate isomerase [Ignavibacteria bacterium]